MDRYKRLNNGNWMPVTGLGVALSGSDTGKAVAYALDHGCVMIDTAKAYGNEPEVGAAIRDSGIPREKLFVTTKLSVPDMEKGYIREAFFDSLDRMGLSYVDLYLIHWPVRERIREAWQIFEELYSMGLTKNIGVSNFQIHDLEAMQKYSNITPVINQIECHPYLTQKELRAYCREREIAVEAWSPLGRAKIFEDPVLLGLAEDHGRTPAQIVLRWHFQNDVITVPKSVRPERILENMDIFGFDLSEEEMSKIDGMNKNHRFGSDPENFHFDA